MKDVDGIVIDLSVRPGLPQDSGSAGPSAGAVAGDNTLIVSLRDDRTSAPITDANVAATASTNLVVQQRPESGRAQGNGVYLVPIRFGVPDTYTVIVTVDRTGRPETTAQFKVTAG